MLWRVYLKSGEFPIANQISHSREDISPETAELVPNRKEGEVKIPGHKFIELAKSVQEIAKRQN